VPNLSNLVFNVLVVLANTTQLGKLFNVFITVLVQEGQHPLTGQRAPPISGGI